MNRSDSIANLAAALAAAAPDIHHPVMDRVNPHYKNRYASLAAHMTAVRAPLGKQGLSVVQTIRTEDLSTEDGRIPPVRVCVETLLVHKSGEWMGDTASIVLPAQHTAQTVGSTVSYLRRYALAAIIGITGDEDDDGEGDRSADRQPEPTKAPAPAPATTKPKAKSKEDAKPADEVETKDSYPDVYEGTFFITRCVRRKGHPLAIHLDGQNGAVWVQCEDRLMDEVESLAGKSAVATLKRIDCIPVIQSIMEVTTNVPF